MIGAMPSDRKTLIPILVMLMVIAFQFVNVYAANGGVDRSQVNRCARRVAPIAIQLEKLRPQLVKAGRTLGNATIGPLISLLDDAERTLDRASNRPCLLQRHAS